jgi:hypothetical protein
MDMSDTIVPKSDQMNFEDFIPPGPDGARDFTITEVRISDADQPVWIYLAEHPQPWKPAKTVRKLLVLGWGPDQTTYIGRRVRLFGDETIRWGGKAVGGIRMSHMSGITTKITANLSETKGKRVLHVVEPLPDADPMRDRVQTAVGAWSGKGVTLQQLEQWVGAARLAWSDQTLADLQGLWRSLANGETTLIEVWPPEAEDAPAVPPAADPSDLDLEPSAEEIARSEGQPR